LRVKSFYVLGFLYSILPWGGEKQPKQTFSMINLYLENQNQMHENRTWRNETILRG